jgi:arylsulfatase A-like enzyme
VLSLTAARAAEPGRPNVIVFLADDLGYGDPGCYGRPRIKTPNLDAFDRQGVRLTRC